MSDVRVFGEIPGFPVGSQFASRVELSEAGVHRPNQAGISGSQAEGADSIVLNEGYEDDEDHGDEIVYTGHGGRDPNTGSQTTDQHLTLGNLAPAVSQTQGLPVRVIRGPKLKSPVAPASGYRYDGLYYVEDHWQDRGRAGFVVWRYRLRRDDGTGAPWAAPAPPTTPPQPPERRSTTIRRIVRNTATAQKVKVRHDFRCQVCGVRLETPVGPYAEGAHIRPLGAPHHGPDKEDNILCLCPNHHTLLDAGAFVVVDDLPLIGVDGRLRTVRGHGVSSQHLAYHRAHYGSTRTGTQLPGDEAT